MDKKSQNSFSLAIHGGAGGVYSKVRKQEKLIYDHLETVLEAGRTLLAKGGSALDTVNLCVRMLEDDPLFNAGCGAVANAAGRYELDASIMDGKTLQAGAVAAVVNVKNPVDLARLVMKKTPHVLLCGPGAIDFAKAQDVPTVTQRYFKSAETKVKDLVDKSSKHGTVGAVARDIKSNVAAATSTGGYDKKMPGRIGDSPLIGAGNYADNASGAISCTGIGEHFIRTGAAAYAAFLIEHDGLNAQQAAQKTINRLKEKVKADGAFILVDKDGNVAIAQNATVMRCGWIEHNGPALTTLQAPIRAQSQ
ncbi:MAG: isoaspartyl peptidase/L-asparaginase [Rhodospirillales bacterium]|nr:isoaspartyl peptidase/L-asparaginase [Rhodospirillales bacterium]MCB9995256.1 isoaspartyl peptidase/L-asparaginase [Rhodospirillales bacterium]